MINKIIEMLLLSDFYGESENIDIAKGKYKFTTFNFDRNLNSL